LWFQIPHLLVVNPGPEDFEQYLYELGMPSEDGDHEANEVGVVYGSVVHDHSEAAVPQYWSSA
jgi:hypothetical protein